MIEFNNVGLKFGDTRIIEDLSFSINRGEFFCILGPSGCGKSTTLRLIGDLLKDYSVKITIAGKSPTECWDQMAYVFQNPRLLPWKNTLDNAAFGLEMRHPDMSKEIRNEIALKQLTKVGLGSDINKMPLMLSGGERQRVSLARALSLEPEIILMDEPFSALDPNTRRILRSQLVQLWQDIGMTIIFVTHDIDEALELGDRIIVLGTRPSKVEKIINPYEKRPRDVDISDELRNIKKELKLVFENLAKTKVN